MNISLCVLSCLKQNQHKPLFPTTLSLMLDVTTTQVRTALRAHHKAGRVERTKSGSYEYSNSHWRHA